MNWIFRIFSSAVFILFLWFCGLLWYTSMMPKQAPSAPKADAIVVLTGAKGRIEEGFRLLAAGAAPILFISGVGDDVRQSDLTRSLPAELQKKLKNIPKQSIILGHRARNTIGNAEETMQWLEQSPKSSILLVTSHYHVPRSLSEFDMLMPTLHVIAVPVIADEFPKNWWREKNSRELALSEYHKFLASKLRHWFVFASDAT